MNNIIKISKNEIGNTEVNSVNSREIYEYLEVKTDYSEWIKRAINKYDFIENIDYIRSELSLPKNGERDLSGLQGKIDYIVTLDMAKELCMVSNTLKGKETRKYFIECEKKLYSKPKELSYEELMRDALYLADSKVKELQIENKTLNNVLEEQKPKVAFANSVGSSKDSILISAFAKAISNNEFTIGSHKLFEYLRNSGYLISRGENHNLPIQKYIDNGYFEVCERVLYNPDGKSRIILTPKITGKGQLAIAKRIREVFYVYKAKLRCRIDDGKYRQIN